MKLKLGSLILLGLMLLAVHSAAVSAARDGSQGFVIQDAIDSAKPGDRIEVANDTYFESLVISTKISLVGIDNPIIDAGQNGSAITIFADGVIVEGFIITNSSFTSHPEEQGGIRVLSNNNIIRNNILTDNWDDIVLFHSSGNLIYNNTLADAEEGLDMIRSDNNSVFQNLIVNDEDGIFIDNSHNNYVYSNRLINCTDDGLLCINNSEDNLVEGNYASGSRWHGLEFFFSDNNTMINNVVNSSGVSNIFVLGSKNINIIGNQANNGESCGIALILSDGNLISRNEVFQNDLVGISLDSSNENAIIFNSVIGSGLIGIDVSSSHNNTFYGNNLSQNLNYSAYDDGKNYWGSPDNANRYSDFDEGREGCFDKNHRGICDQAYPIPGSWNADRYPMAKLSPGEAMQLI